MVYRANITYIQAYVECNYNLNKYTIVRDQRRTYIELFDETEAELLEDMNRTRLELDDLIRQHQEYIN